MSVVSVITYCYKLIVLILYFIKLFILLCIYFIEFNLIFFENIFITLGGALSVV